MNHFHNFGIGVVAANIGSWVLMYLNPLLSAVFTGLSIMYLLWKWRNDYLKKKRNESIAKGN